MVPWRPSLSVLLLTALVLAVPLPNHLTADAAAAGSCAEPVPLAAVTPGLTGRGLTVVRGDEPEPFDVTVIDVLRDGLAPGVPLIVVEVSHPEVTRLGGVWAGMSGSPVYVGDRLLGAISYGFSGGPSPIVGVTPAGAMLALPSRGPAAEAAGLRPAEVQPTARVLAAAARSGEAGSLAPLRVPLLVSGLTGERFDRFADVLEHRFPGALVVRSAGVSGSATAGTPLEPGSNLAVSFMYGDATVAALGTATTVCDGVVTGFGHPVTWEGATRLGMHGATTVQVLGDVWGPFELANLGPPIGRVDQDRGAGIAGRLGRPPTPLVITSSITDRDTGRTVTGRTDAYFPDPMWAVMGHLYVNFDVKALDDPWFAGTSAVAWTIQGTRADGRSWKVSRQNRHADRYDLSSASLWEVASTVQQLHDNPFEEVTVGSVHFEAEAGSPYRSLALVADQVTAAVGAGPQQPIGAGITVGPGQAIRLRVPLRLHRGEVHMQPITLLVPPDASGMMGELAVGAEPAPDVWECLYDPQACGQAGTASIDDLLAAIQARPRADDLAVLLHLYPGEGQPVEGTPVEAPVPDAPSTTRTTVRLTEVLQGLLTLPVTVAADAGEGCPVDATLPFEDVPTGSTHAASVACAATLGLTDGVSVDPPRYAPDRPVRRDQAATFVARLVAAGPRALPAAGARFDDLAGNVHRDAVEQLAAAGIVNGRTASAFDPAGPVTREQLASMVVAALRWATGDELLPATGPRFTDVSRVHAEGVQVAHELGVVLGRADGTFGAGLATRRDQVATVLIRALAALTCAAPG